MKKMLRIQKQKERKERERQIKQGQKVSIDVSDITITQEQTDQLFEKYTHSKKNQEVTEEWNGHFVENQEK